MSHKETELWKERWRSEKQSKETASSPQRKAQLQPILLEVEANLIDILLLTPKTQNLLYPASTVASAELT